METCLDCEAELPLKVLKSAAGHYIGYFCPNCGPYGRISEYFQTAALAEAYLITMARISNE